MNNLPNIAGLSARRKADRQRISGAFLQIAFKHGAEVEAREEPAQPGWSGPAIVLSGSLNGVGFLLDIDDLHERSGQLGGLISWYNAGIGKCRDFSAEFNLAVKDYKSRPHHKASSIGDWPELLRQFDRALQIAGDSLAFRAVEAIEAGGS